MVNIDDLSTPVNSIADISQPNVIYRLTVYSNYEEDSDDPYTVDYNSMDEALNAKISYESELTLCGQHAYLVVGPDVVR